MPTLGDISSYLSEQIRGRLAQKVIAAQPDQVAPPPPAGQVDAQVAYSTVKQFQEFFQLNYDRRNRYADFKAMDVGDIAAILDHVTFAAFTFEDVDNSYGDELERPKGFKVVVDDYRKGMKRDLINDLLTSTKIKDKLFQYTREMLKMGDTVIEMITQDGSIVSTQSYEMTNVFVQVNDKNQFLPHDPKETDPLKAPRAYEVHDDVGHKIAGFDPWEVVHWKYRPNDRKPYSERSFLDIIRDDWHKLRWIEQSMVIARVTRAYPREFHKIDVTYKSDADARAIIREYIRTNTHKLVGDRYAKVLMQPEENYYRGTGYITGGREGEKPLPRLDDIVFHDPSNAGLSNIVDVEYLRRKLFNQVPSSIVGIENNSNDIPDQELAFQRIVQDIQDQVEVGIKKLIDTELIIHDMSPGGYRIVWPQLKVISSWKHSDAKFRNSMANANDLTKGMSTVHEILKNERHYTDEQIDDHFKFLDEEYKKYPWMFIGPPKQSEEDDSTKTNKSSKQAGGQAANINRARGGNNSA